MLLNLIQVLHLWSICFKVANFNLHNYDQKTANKTEKLVFLTTGFLSVVSIPCVIDRIHVHIQCSNYYADQFEENATRNSIMQSFMLLFRANLR